MEPISLFIDLNTKPSSHLNHRCNNLKLTNLHEATQPDDVHAATMPDLEPTQ